MALASSYSDSAAHEVDPILKSAYLISADRQLDEADMLISESILLDTAWQ
jgi:hypothetical protein